MIFWKRRQETSRAEGNRRGENRNKGYTSRRMGADTAEPRGQKVEKSEQKNVENEAEVERRKYRSGR